MLETNILTKINKHILSKIILFRKSSSL